jgi:hypothetical protein
LIVVLSDSVPLSALVFELYASDNATISPLPTLNRKLNLPLVLPGHRILLGH